MKPNPTAEAAFETVVETHLLCHGYKALSRNGFDRALALFSQEALAFILGTQAKALAKLEQLLGKITCE